jgi:glycosyltransferase involved in cell wall biosynthesis
MNVDSTQERSKILFVTSHWPLAPAYGAQQRVLNIARLLQRFGDVSFVIVPTEVEEEATVRRTVAEFKVHKVIRPYPVAPARSFARLAHRLRHELDPAYTTTEPYEAGESDQAALQELIFQHDLVWVHTVRTAHWFPDCQWPHSVLDLDDVPSRLYATKAGSGDIPVRRVLDLRMSWIWRRRERSLPQRFNVITVCSEDDRRYLGQSAGIHVIPNGSDPSVRRRPSPGPPRIGFLGNFAFEPNEEGVRWFIRDVWPQIKRKLPLAQLRLVGRDSEGYLTKLGPDVIARGWLEDPHEEIASWSAMIVPIKRGSGTRVKIAEAFANKCPVVTTTIGAFGYEVTNGEEIFLADHADDFASACLTLLSDPERAEVMSRKAHERFLERWMWSSFESTVGSAVKECLAGKQPSLITS